MGYNESQDSKDHVQKWGLLHFLLSKFEQLHKWHLKKKNSYKETMKTDLTFSLSEDQHNSGFSFLESHAPWKAWSQNIWP